MNVDNERKRLFKQMKDILDVSHKKFSADKGRGNTDMKRMKWARVFISGFAAYGKLLETIQVEQLAKDVEAIKQKVGIK